MSEEMLQGYGVADNVSTGIMVKVLPQQGRWGTGCVPNAVFYNKLMDVCCRKEDVEKTCNLFREIHSRIPVHLGSIWNDDRRVL
ncbi:unnamed protein product [Spirodela intermedia]|uniref:Uncharacterized protein n=1 Tax=Spirodela intermedia TaxID=51605 RepID=A0ABN7E874_SPIIN|nr:unnamed protein product [Spirodela intermedia]